MLKVSQTETSGTADDEVENGPAKAEAAGLTREAADDLGPPLDLAPSDLWSSKMTSSVTFSGGREVTAGSQISPATRQKRRAMVADFRPT
jgi:hypothetical protein